MKSLQQLISEKESELQNLEDSLGLGFPIVEQAKMVQISHLQLELEDLRQIEVRYQLNDNQKIVLEWLVDELERNGVKPLKIIHRFVVEGLHKRLPANAQRAYFVLDDKQQFEVLAAFAQWGLEKEEADEFN